MEASASTALLKPMVMAGSSTCVVLGRICRTRMRPLEAPSAGALHIIHVRSAAKAVRVTRAKLG